MLYKTMSAAVYGIDASIIDVEVDVSNVDVCVRDWRGRVLDAVPLAVGVGFSRRAPAKAGAYLRLTAVACP